VASQLASQSAWLGWADPLPVHAAQSFTWKPSLPPAVSDPSKDLTIEVELEPAPSPAASTTSHSTAPGTTVIPGVGTAYVSIQECTRPAPANAGPPVTKTVALATFIPHLPSCESISGRQGSHDWETCSLLLYNSHAPIPAQHF
jgi:hypothetical protein